MKAIKTNSGIYEYEEIKFQNGVKVINKEISKSNLLDLKKELDKSRVRFGLMYGTLLGAIRENDFIAHDEDTDIFILQEDEESLLDTLFELRNIGFEVGRYTTKLISIIRNGEYIDIYIFEKKGMYKRVCEGYIIKSEFLENLEEYEFLGEIFNIPQKAEQLLIDLYGLDWKTPQKNSPASNYGIYLSIKFFIKNKSKILFEVIRWAKHKLNV
jgi:phosphorylcholine metabolism protein LicD